MTDGVSAIPFTLLQILKFTSTLTEKPRIYENPNIYCLKS